MCGASPVLRVASCELRLRAACACGVRRAARTGRPAPPPGPPALGMVTPGSAAARSASQGPADLQWQPRPGYPGLAPPASPAGGWAPGPFGGWVPKAVGPLLRPMPLPAVAGSAGSPPAEADGDLPPEGRGSPSGSDGETSPSCGVLDRLRAGLRGGPATGNSEEATPSVLRTMRTARDDALEGQRRRWRSRSRPRSGHSGGWGGGGGTAGARVLLRAPLRRAGAGGCWLPGGDLSLAAAR